MAKDESERGWRKRGKCQGAVEIKISRARRRDQDVSLPVQCLFLSSSLLKIYWEAWGEMDGLREGGNKRDGGVRRCPLKGKEHLDSLYCKKTSHVSLFSSFPSFSVFLIALSFSCQFISSLFLPLAAALPFLTYSRIYREIYCKIEVWPEPTVVYIKEAICRFSDSDFHSFIWQVYSIRPPI